jgi:DNA modification methylase
MLYFYPDLAATGNPMKTDTHLEILPVSVMEIGPMGKQGVRGNTNHDSQSSRSGYSPFPHEIAETCAALFLRDSSRVADPFAGWGERGAAMKRHGKSYYGFDLSPDAITNAEEKYGVKNTLADSRSVEVPRHDGLLTCPPYWNLEKYAGVAGLDRCRGWASFLDEYRAILGRFAEKAEAGSTYCILTGDWRDAGTYYDLTFQTELIMSQLGFYPFDKVVASRLTISKIKIMLPQAKRLGYTVKVHEMLSVFKKPGNKYELL